MGNQKPKIGDIVEVEWLDAVGLTNQAKSKAKPVKAKNIGKWIEDQETHVVLQTGIYLDDGADPDGDFTVIPKGVGWLQNMRLIKRG